MRSGTYLVDAQPPREGERGPQHPRCGDAVLGLLKTLAGLSCAGVSGTSTGDLNAHHEVPSLLYDPIHARFTAAVVQLHVFVRCTIYIYICDVRGVRTQSNSSRLEAGQKTNQRNDTQVVLPHVPAVGKGQKATEQPTYRKHKSNTLGESQHAGFTRKDVYFLRSAARSKPQPHTDTRPPHRACSGVVGL